MALVLKLCLTCGIVWVPCQPGFSREKNPLEAMVRCVPASERNHRRDQWLIVHSFLLETHSEST